MTWDFVSLCGGPSTAAAMCQREAVSTARRCVVAVDIGGTKLAGAVIDEQGGVRRMRQVSTPPDLEPEVVWDALATLVTAVAADAGSDPDGVSVASAGPLDLRAGTVSPVNIAAWREFPLRDRLAALTGLPVALAGDAACMAAGEHWRGAGRGVDDLLGVVVSTGVGGGLVLAGRLHLGASGNAGHVGHVVVDPAGDACPCGARGCLETIASGPALVRWARAQGWRAHHPAPAVVSGDAADLAADAAEGDEVARAAYERGGRALGQAFAAVAAIVDVAAVVVGGGVARAGGLLFEPMAAEVAAAGLAFVRRVDVRPGSLDVEAGLMGAAARVLEPDRYGAG